MNAAPYHFLQIGLEVGAGLLLLLICWQDWQTRSVTWLAFPVLGGLLLSHRLLSAPVAVAGGDLAVNWAGLGGLLLLLWLYVRLRFRGAGLRLQDCLGSGDVAFWFVVASYFSPVSFLLYLLGSSVLALVGFGLLCWARLAGPDRRVPLAGLQAAGLVLLLGYGWANPAWTVDTGEARLLTWLTAW